MNDSRPTSTIQPYLAPPPLRCHSYPVVPHPHKHNVPDSFHPVGVNLTQEARGRRKNGDWGLGEEMRVEREKKVGGRRENGVRENGVWLALTRKDFDGSVPFSPFFILLTLTQVVSLGL